MQNVASIVLIFLMITKIGWSQTVPAPYEVGTWAGFRTAAITYSFDDGCAGQFTTAIPLFDEFGYKLTLNLVPAWISSWPSVVSAAQNGHEVASHSITHPDLSKLTANQQNDELGHSKSILQSQIPGYRCLTIAYPYCVRGADSICSKYYISARSCQGYVESKTPSSYYNISSVGCGSLSSVKTLENFKTYFVKALSINGWCTFLLHGVDNDGGYSPIASAELRKSLEYLHARKSQYWVTTFLNATLYSQERNAVSLTQISATDTSRTLMVTDNLPDSIYQFPLTFRLPLPLNWPSANVTQNAVEVTKRIVKVDTIVYLAFDAIPDAGEVLISKNNTAIIPEEDSIPDESGSTGFIEPTPNIIEMETYYANSTFIVSFPDMETQSAQIGVYNLQGVKLFSKSVMNPAGRKISLHVNPSNMMPGIYVVTVNNGKNIWNKKIIVN